MESKQLDTEPELNEQVKKDTIHISSNSTSKLVIIIITVLLIFAIIIALTLSGLKKLYGNYDSEINDLINTIDQSFSEIKNSDFSDNLDINFDITTTPALSQKTTEEIDNSIKEINNMLEDLNNQSDFKDFENINFNQ